MACAHHCDDLAESGSMDAPFHVMIPSSGVISPEMARGSKSRENGSDPISPTRPVLLNRRLMRACWEGLLVSPGGKRVSVNSSTALLFYLLRASQESNSAARMNSFFLSTVDAPSFSAERVQLRDWFCLRRSFRAAETGVGEWICAAQADAIFSSSSRKCRPSSGASPPRTLS